MNKIEFVDQTIRDAQQSLWGLMMRTDHIIPIAEKMNLVDTGCSDGRLPGIYIAGSQS